MQMHEDGPFESTSPPQRSTRSYVQTIIRLTLCIAALIGIWRTIGASRQVAALQVELARLTKSVGHMPIKDPTKVYVLAIPQEREHTWRFRVYLPPKYDASEIYRYGRISATTSRHQYTSGGSSSSGVISEPAEYFVTIALIKENGAWGLHTNSRNSRGSGGVGHEFGDLLESSESLVIETAGTAAPQEFDPDEPICLLRMRSREPIHDKDKSDPLYNGFFYYIVPRQAVQKFEATSG
jgi:hypothetical protein